MSDGEGGGRVTGMIVLLMVVVASNEWCQVSEKDYWTPHPPSLSLSICVFDLISLSLSLSPSLSLSLSLSLSPLA